MGQANGGPAKIKGEGRLLTSLVVVPETERDNAAVEHPIGTHSASDSVKAGPPN